MRFVTVILTVALFTSFAQAQPKQSPLDQAAKAEQTVVVFVGLPSRPISGALSIRDDSYHTQSYAIVVLIPDGKGWFTATRGDTSATDEEISGSISQLRTAGASTGRTFTSVEALEELNAARAARGLHPYLRDDGLTQAAMACAKHRAERLIQGHSSNDFGFVPSGSSASAAGCAAWEPSLGWGSCCAYEGWTYAGAAWALGSDGRRCMQLFVR